MNREKVIIKNDGGEEVEAMAPVIVSASRATDIPAFYAEWFIERIRKGYVRWVNPFSGASSYVSFRNLKVVVFWSKNPEPLIPFFGELDERGIHYYVQFTLNDYDREGLEPRVPPLAQRIDTFRRLSDLIGREKVIWRFDPLILSPDIAPRDLLKKIWYTGNELKGFTDKLVFSFVDVRVYRKVGFNLVRDTSFYSGDTVGNAEPDGKQMLEIAEGLAKIRERWGAEGWPVELATCAEMANLEAFGIAHNRCVDDVLMRRIFHSDEALMYYLSYGKLPDGFSLFADKLPPVRPLDWKDKGQRKACGCMISKDIGAYDTCPHFCKYCYANTSPKVVAKNYKRYMSDKQSDALSGSSSS
jgi:DNA repair photolyase